MEFKERAEFGGARLGNPPSLNERARAVSQRGGHDHRFLSHPIIFRSVTGVTFSVQFRRLGGTMLLMRQ